MSLTKERANRDRKKDERGRERIRAGIDRREQSTLNSQSVNDSWMLSLAYYLHSVASVSPFQNMRETPKDEAITFDLLSVSPPRIR